MASGPVTPRLLGHRFETAVVKHRAMLLTETLEARHPGIVSQLRADPLEALAGFPEVEFHLLPHLDEVTCSVLGHYDSNPPSIQVVRSTSESQTWFTALHELGHHEQGRDFDWVLNRQQSTDPVRLEEQVCEAFAAEILLPDEIVRQVIEETEPTARSIADLRDITNASRSACAVRVAQLLKGDGVAMVTKIDGEVFFAAATGDAVAPKRATKQADGIFDRAARTGRSQANDAAITYGTGSTRGGFAADVLRDGHFLYAIFTTARPGWAGKFHAPARSEWTAQELECKCGANFDAGRGDPCKACGKWNACPDCGRCACNSRASTNRQCTVCNMVQATTMFDDEGTVCRDCGF